MYVRLISWGARYADRVPPAESRRSFSAAFRIVPVPGSKDHGVLYQLHRLSSRHPRLRQRTGTLNSAAADFAHAKERCSTGSPLIRIRTYRTHFIHLSLNVAHLPTRDERHPRRSVRATALTPPIQYSSRASHGGKYRRLFRGYLRAGASRRGPFASALANVVSGFQDSNVQHGGCA